MSRLFPVRAFPGILVLAAVFVIHSAFGAGRAGKSAGELSPSAIAAILKQVDGYQLAHPVMRGTNRNWERGTWYSGVMAAYLATGDKAYLDQAQRWAERQQWKPGTERAGANVLTCCQTYLQLYFLDPDPAFIEPTVRWLDSDRPNTPGGAKIWYLENNLRYADSLYVGAPTLAMLARATGNHKYIDWMNAFFSDVQAGLFDKNAGLFYRDKRFIGQKTANGKRVFWSRGNGWVFASLPRILSYLPDNDPARARYESLFKQMAAAILDRQQPDGLWRPNLDDPEEFAMPETSGSGFFCYGLAWGARSGLLDFGSTLPVVKKAWAGLVSSVSPEGKVQWGQRVGDRPAAVKESDSQEYVTGAFLLAGSEVFRLVEDGFIGEPTPQRTKVRASRQGAAAGAKPCRYDSRPRPSILVTPQTLARVREAVLKGNGEQHRVYENTVKRNADLWLHRSIVIPGVGGWAHYFFCTDGTQLVLPKDQRFDPNVPSKCPACGKTYLNPKILGARRFFEHYWLESAARDLALAYAIEQKKEYAAKAAEILIKYADAFPYELGDGGFQGVTLSEAVSLIPLAEAYDLVCDTMTPSQREHVVRDFFWPAAQSLTRAGFRGNWGSWHLSAIGVIGYASRHQRFIDFATAQFKSQIANQLGDDGLWPESVGTYHFYALDAFLGFAEAAANCGDDLFAWVAPAGSETNPDGAAAENGSSPRPSPIHASQYGRGGRMGWERGSFPGQRRWPGKGLEAMFEAPLWYAYPNLRLAAINDGWFAAWLPRDQYTLAYYRYHRPEFAWAIRRLEREGKSGNPGQFMARNYRYVLYGETLPPQIPKPVFASTDFPVLGIAVLRQGSNLPADKEMMLTLHYGPFLGHGHYDKMGVTLFANGKLLVPDYGTSGYGIPLSHFLQSAPGHNTIVVDGKNQKRTHDRNLIEFKVTPDFKLASARTTELVRGATWTRTVLLADKYAVIWDRITGAEKHQYDWFFHAEGRTFSLCNQAGDKLLEANPAQGEFHYGFIDSVKEYTLHGSSIAQWTSGDSGLRLWAMGNPGETAFAGRFPTPEIRKVPLLVLRQKSANAQFVAVLRPWQGPQEANDARVQFRRAASGDVLVTVKIGKREDTIRLGKTVDYLKAAGRRPAQPPM